MPLNLIDLIRAGLVTPAPGQGFRNYVAGSPVTGTKMTDYIIGPMSILGPLISNYDSSEFSFIPGDLTVNMTADFTVIGPKFPSIRATTPIGLRSGWNFYVQSVDNPQPELIVNSVTWGALSATVNTTVRGPFDADGTFKSVTLFQAWFDGYPDGVTPWGVTPNSNTYTVTFLPRFTTKPNTTTRYTVCNLFFRYDPDVGPFNTPKIVGPIQRNILWRAYPDGTVMYEWNFYETAATNPNVTPGATQVASSYQSGPGFSVTVHPWYRLKAEYGGNGTWIAYNAPSQTGVTWTDPRV